MIERLEEFIVYLGISVRAFEQAIGASNGLIRKAITNKSDIQSKWISKIVDIFPQLNIEWLLVGNGEMLKENINEYKVLPEESSKSINEPLVSIYNLKTDYYGVERQQIPLYEVEASAGLSLLFSNQSQQVPLDHIILPNAPRCDGAMYIRGDSMYPLIKSGDIACYKVINNIDNVIYGEKYILDINNEDDEYLTVKYVQKSDKGSDYLKLVSENKHHADRDIRIQTIRALAMVKITIRFEH